jgi:hypothetical protein
MGKTVEFEFGSLYGRSLLFGKDGIHSTRGETMVVRKIFILVFIGSVLVAGCGNKQADVDQAVGNFFKDCDAAYEKYGIGKRESVQKYLRGYFLTDYVDTTFCPTQKRQTLKYEKKNVEENRAKIKVITGKTSLGFEQAYDIYLVKQGSKWFMCHRNDYEGAEAK